MGFSLYLLTLQHVSNSAVLFKPEIDKANKDIKNKLFPPDFHIELRFSVACPEVDRLYNVLVGFLFVFFGSPGFGCSTRPHHSSLFSSHQDSINERFDQLRSLVHVTHEQTRKHKGEVAVPQKAAI